MHHRTSSLFHRKSPRVGLFLVAGCVAAAAITDLSPAATAAPRPQAATQGTVGIGDRLYPGLGNGGYDAIHYALNLRYATAAPSQGIDGNLTMTARATQALSRFDLDFAGKGVGGVTVDGRPATFRRTGAELLITPAVPVVRGDSFTVRVGHFSSDPTLVVRATESTTAFAISPDGSATAGQPNLMHRVFPANDHPADKATYSFRFDVPAGQTAVANGDLTSRSTAAGRTVWRYEMREPMATELACLVVGRFTVVERGTVAGVRVRDVLPTRLLASYDTRLAIETSQLEWLTKRLGAYPFGQYGSLVNDAPVGFALENQTLSLYDPVWWTKPAGVWQPTMLRALAHQWFGDDVSPATWSDFWLNEGHSSWYALLYASQHEQLTDYTGLTGSFTQVMRQYYARGDSWRARSGPVARPTTSDQLFSDNVDRGGAVALYALWNTIGKTAFRQLERAWLKTYHGGSATTQDFIRLASQVSGTDLTAFLTDWLYGTKTPPMPGHPDWKVMPVTTTAR